MQLTARSSPPTVGDGADEPPDRRHLDCVDESSRSGTASSGPDGYGLRDVLRDQLFNHTERRSALIVDSAART